MTSNFIDKNFPRCSEILKNKTGIKEEYKASDVLKSFKNYKFENEYVTNYRSDSEIFNNEEDELIYQALTEVEKDLTKNRYKII